MTITFRRRHAVWALLSAAILSLGLLAGCSSFNSNAAGSAAAAEQGAQAADALNYDRNQPIPVFDTSVYRQEVIDTEAVQALGTVTTSFGYNLGSNKPLWSCPSLGMPVPVNAQLSNPSQVIPDPNDNGGSNRPSLVIPQEDPNGVYALSGTGTYIECLSSTGLPYYRYWEGFVDTVTGAASYNPATGQETLTGKPVLPVCATVPAGHGLARHTHCVKPAH